ncbi:diguanylate cyclase [Cupriavidus taiwanensis]|uniref:Putative diguanylate cyclase (GGDEF domain) with PAS sensor domain and HAMP domain n=1 Tax=Cupriavidus taiwanensis TaxID=164546 RepID=A0A375HC53_9BURK|nr:diguanylate cyclase [Cupriavidus taiwanensis]SOY69231.1 putative diguanylate cyclase (GGDEF domain) with PAS sensor domain and HAMP domain [Cupriavidus taiwanensis]SOY69910.1 putative diguanylate cyclase (GGDEF domain) with PAS sensor domain and HAMP domain [Cupriavidus taiwanensis]SOY92295.1 putative diguanylate cyclase (GGDEF domain) with PAS sensor domain and HAMP domain [Cupriavidus taiwanensis]SOZ29451.1 putative diguanylate cyclase (GGDEF domain) with PAS sensor domain and HAMP domain 
MPVYTPTLKARIAIITTVLAAVFGTGIILIALYDAHSDLHDALEGQQDSVVKLTANQLDTAMNDRIQLLSHQAGQLGGLLAQAHGAAARQRALQALSAAIPVPAAFNALLVADQHGNVLSDLGDGAEVSDRAYFREAARTLAPVVSPPIRSRASGQMGVLVAVPVLSPQRGFLGLVGGWLDLSSANFLVDILHNRLGTTGYYCLVSAGREPVYVRHPDPAQARQPARPVADTCGEDDSPAPLEFLTPARPVIARYLMSSTGWELVALLPAREAYAPLRQMQQRFLGMAGVAMAGVALLIWLAVRRQLAPLSRLHRVVLASANDLSAFERLPTRQQRDEIGDLTRAFIKLMRDVRERRQALDRSERRLRAVTDTLPSLLAFVDTEARYVFNNLAYERVFGLKPEQLRGRPMREVLGEARFARVRPFLERALAGSAVTFETEDEGSDYHCMETSLRPEWSADGSEVVGVHVHVQDITQRKLETRRLARMSRTDHLTQLLNRSAFEGQLHAAMARSRDEGTLMALLYLDMDRFKAVNDIHGHAAGDLLLQDFAQRVRDCVRDSDTVARLGGDEFAVVLEDLPQPAAARRVAQAILQAMDVPFSFEGVRADVDVSIGVALYRGGPAQDHELMRLADVLLYRAKGAGRGRYEIGPPELADAPGPQHARPSAAQ